MVDVTDNCGDTDRGGAPRGGARRFGPMPNLVVPQDFDAPLPDAEYAAWEGATDHEQETAYLLRSPENPRRPL
jgi:hypothetical protein